MGFPVLFIHTAAFRTGPGGIPGIDKDYRNAFHQGLIGHKGAELTKGPVMQPVSLAFSGRNLFPDAGEIFDGDSGESAFGLGDKLFGDVVVHPCLKTGLSSGEFHESSFAGFGSFLLKNRLSLLKPETLAFDLFSGEDLSGGIGGDVDDAEIDSQDFFRKLRLLLRNVADKIEEPFFAVLAVDEIDFPFPEPEIFPLMLSADEGDLHAARKRPNAGLIPFLEGKDPVVVGLGGPFPKDMDSCFVRGVGVGNFGDTPNDHLRRQRGRSSYLMIFRLMEGKLAEGLRFEGKPGQFIAKIIARFQSLEENLRLIFRRFQFEIDRDLHIVYSILEKLTCQTERRSAFLPGLKSGVSNARTR